MSAKPLEGKGGNYVPKLLALALCGLIEPGRVAAVIVTHDSSCAIHRGGACDCDPDVSIEPAAGPTDHPSRPTTEGEKMKTPDIPIGTDRPPIEDSMSAVQALEDERATRVWLEREKKVRRRQLTSEASVQIEALTLAEAALRQLLIVFADPDLAASTSFNAEYVETLRKDLEAIRDVVMTTGTVVRDGTGQPV